MLTKANQKRFLDDVVIQKGEFDWRSLFGDELALTKALGEFEDRADADAAVAAAQEEVVMEGADEADFGDADVDASEANIATKPGDSQDDLVAQMTSQKGDTEAHDEVEADGSEESGGTVVDYMLAFVRFDWDSFRDWRV
jgi:helicase SWR1